MEGIVQLLLETMRKLLAYMVAGAFLILILNLIYIDDVVRKTTDFVDRVQYEGYIVDDMYLKYLDQLHFNDVKVEMVHIKEQRAIGEPKHVARRYQILSKVFGSEGIYEFEEGDTFYVQIHAKLFFFEVNKQLGGLILNEKYH